MAMKNNHWNFSLNTLSSKWPQFTFPLYHSIISSFNQFLCFNFLFPFFPFLVCFNYLPIFINSFNCLLADLMLVLLCFSTLNVCNSICLERCLFLTSGYREFSLPFLSLPTTTLYISINTVLCSKIHINLLLVYIAVCFVVCVNLICQPFCLCCILCYVWFTFFFTNIVLQISRVEYWLLRFLNTLLPSPFVALLYATPYTTANTTILYISIICSTAGVWRCF